MKIKNLFIMAATVLFAVSCQKAALDETVVEGNDKVIFDITVSESSNKAVGKTAWESGDQIVCFFKNDKTLGHQLRLTYDGSKWAAAFDDPAFVDQLVAFPDKYIYAVHYDGTMAFKVDELDYTLVSEEEDLQGKTFLMKSDIPFTATQSGEKVIFSATIAMERYSNFQLVLTDIPAADAELYSLSDHIDSKLRGTYEAIFDGSALSVGSSDGCAGQNNADGVAFLGHFENGATDIILELRHPSAPDKTYIKIIPAGKFAAKAMTGAYKTTLASFWELTDTTSYVFDEAQNCYRTIKDKKAGLWVMIDNYRYLPGTLKPNDDPSIIASTSHIWYPYNLVGGTAVASNKVEDIFKNGYLYDFYAVFGEEYTTAAAAAKVDSTQAICPTGWRVPSRDDLLSIVGRSTKCVRYGENSDVIKTDASCYIVSAGEAQIVPMDEKGYNVWPTGCVFGSKYLINAIIEEKCNVTDYYGRHALTYWWTSTSSTDTQMMGLMTTWTKDKKDGKLSLAGMNVNPAKNYAFPLRCVKDAE